MAIIIWSARIDGGPDAVTTTWRRKEECLGSQTTVIMCVASVWAEDEDPQDKKRCFRCRRERERERMERWIVTSSLSAQRQTALST